MRNHVIDKITELASEDERIMLVSADLGYNVVNEYAQKFPDRFINVGIAEQNMASMAAGLALEGNLVFTYSIGNFPTLRCIEQIRNDICYHNANVKILAVGGGFAYGDLGMSHHATEDIAMMRALPHMRVYVPADELEALACLQEAIEAEGPAYIRMAKGKEQKHHKDNERLCVDRLLPIISKTGAQISIIAAGTILSEAIKLAELLEPESIEAQVFSSPSVKPLDEHGILELSQRCKLLVSMEDHNVVGGLGDAIASVLSERCSHARLLKVGLKDTFTDVVGDQDYLRNYYGISAERVKEKILEICRDEKSTDNRSQ